jgi:hypothetical protein
VAGAGAGATVVVVVVVAVAPAPTAASCANAAPVAVDAAQATKSPIVPNFTLFIESSASSSSISAAPGRKQRTGLTSLSDGGILYRNVS